MTPGLEERLAPTDCRLRPDQHFLELGQYDQVRYALIGLRYSANGYADQVHMLRTYALPGVRPT